MSRSFDDLTVEEQDKAIKIVSDEFLWEVLNYKIVPLSPSLRAEVAMVGQGLQATPNLLDWVYDESAAIAASAVYIPDDGTKVVRL